VRASKTVIFGTFFGLVAAIALIVFPTAPISADPECVAGMAVYSPIPPYEIADCLEDAGSNCLRCRMIIIVG
jgi:hypothetical protein